MDFQNLTQQMQKSSEKVLHQLEQWRSKNEFSPEEQGYIVKMKQYLKKFGDKISASLQQLQKKKENPPTIFFENLRHDLRNDLSAVIGYGELLLELQEEAKGSSQPLRDIVAKCQKLVQSTHQIGQEQPALQQEDFKESVTASSSSTHSDLNESPEFTTFKKQFPLLLVDDLATNCQLLALQLQKMGYETIHAAYDVVTAKAILEKETIHLLLLDINMPDISGIQFLEELKEDIEKGHLMVIMVTGADTLDNAIRCITLGAEDFLTKPINFEMLRVRIGACVRKKWFQVLEHRYLDKIEIERKRYEQLLSSIFPPIIVTELTQTGHVTAKNYHDVATLFVDVVSFTQFCDTHLLEVTMQGIQNFSEICESSALTHHLQKIKTIGDGFLATAGMLERHEKPVLDCIRCALDILNRTKKTHLHWLVRAGIDYGTVIGGVVGHRQYLFDIWGDSVNTAARVQGVAKPDKICMTDKAYATVRSECMARSLGFMPLRGKTTPIELFEFEKIIVK